MLMLYPINIDKMIADLQSLKEQGSTHVEVDYNCDHIGYEISGYSITTSTKEEIEIYENKQATEGQKQKLYNIPGFKIDKLPFLLTKVGDLLYYEGLLYECL